MPKYIIDIQTAKIVRLPGMDVIEPVESHRRFPVLIDIGGENTLFSDGNQLSIIDKDGKQTELPKMRQFPLGQPATAEGDTSLLAVNVVLDEGAILEREMHEAVENFVGSMFRGAKARKAGKATS